MIQLMNTPSTVVGDIIVASSAAAAAVSSSSSILNVAIMATKYIASMSILSFVPLWFLSSFDCNPSLYVMDKYVTWWQRQQQQKQRTLSLGGGIIKKATADRSIQETIIHHRNIWLIGSSSGIGEEMAYQLASSAGTTTTKTTKGTKDCTTTMMIVSLHLILSSRSDSELKRVQEQCETIMLQNHVNPLYGKVSIIPFDVTSSETNFRQTIQTVKHEFQNEKDNTNSNSCNTNNNQDQHNGANHNDETTNHGGCNEARTKTVTATTNAPTTTTTTNTRIRTETIVIMNAGCGHLSPALDMNYQSIISIMQRNAIWQMLLTPLLFEYSFFPEYSSTHKKEIPSPPITTITITPTATKTSIDVKENDNENNKFNIIMIVRHFLWSTWTFLQGTKKWRRLDRHQQQQQQQQCTYDPPHIVVTSSVGGIVPIPLSSYYCAAKHALHGYFRTFHSEYPNVRIQLICPGPIDTHFHSHNLKSSTTSQSSSNNNGGNELHNTIIKSNTKKSILDKTTSVPATDTSLLLPVSKEAYNVDGNRSTPKTSNMKMPVKRCVSLMLCGIFSLPHHSMLYIAQQPILLGLYLEKILPYQFLNDYLYKQIGQKRMELYQSGKDLYDPKSWRK